MNADEFRSNRRPAAERGVPVRRPRKVARPALPAGPGRDLRDSLYTLYEAAGCPTMQDIAARITADDRLDGCPAKDKINRMIRTGECSTKDDSLAVAMTLARLAGQDVHLVATRFTQLWTSVTTGQPITPEPSRLGSPVSQCDPFLLGVHHPIDSVSSGRRLERLPSYRQRPVDTTIREASTSVLAGESRLVTLVGGPATGKSRACWELVRKIDAEQPGRWRIWHPYDPTRPQAAITALDQVGPHTIVWLNDAHHYLDTGASPLGEQIAARLRTLLHDPGRRPILVLATAWPHYWSQFTTAARPGQPDPHAQVRDLLTGTAIFMPATFSARQLAELAGSDIDPRLREAARRAENGRIVQYLAGAPALDAHYRAAPPAARAVLEAAMDARRLGYPVGLSRALLKGAAPGYLDDHDWDALADDWLDHALAYTAIPCNGTRGPLTAIRPRPQELTTIDLERRYRLADSLEHTARLERAAIYPPETLWAALAANVTDPALLRHLGEQAWRRLRFQQAIQFYNLAAGLGEPRAVTDLATVLHHAGDKAGAERLLLQAADGGDDAALQVLASRREQAKDPAGAETILLRAAEGGSNDALLSAADLRRTAGDLLGAQILCRRAVDRGSTDAMVALAGIRERLGDSLGADRLLRQAVDNGDPMALQWLFQRRINAHDIAGAEQLCHAAIDLEMPEAWLLLAELRQQQGDLAGAIAQLEAAADRRITNAVMALAKLTENGGDPEAAEVLYRQAAELGNARAWSELAYRRDRANDQAGAEAVCREAAEHGVTRPLLWLASLHEKSRDIAGAEALYQLAADHGDNDALLDLASLRADSAGPAGAEATYRQAANRGDLAALIGWHELLQQTGHKKLARQLERYGLTPEGDIASTLHYRTGDVAMH
ncbi:hypothetical protein OWR29_26565 [Actinoplanes sp. Pm04-4]|uniref:Uncharacterized protein n=1 Tax=Paractinoplanes pyxinae TaxID=2997416 RepID=A0ABT4B4Z7_9ACTN|nr:hypothetical protein [Actinoplanes pyxinae]MCY1141577.1 hypothetical protein [Actinoplanes pyxinae]